MKKNNFFMKMEYLKFTSYFNRKKFLLLFLLLFLAVLIPTISGSIETNFWMRMYNILNNPFFNMLMSLSISFNVLFYMSELFKNYEVISRYSSYKEILNKYSKDIVWSIGYLNIVAIILVISGAILFCFGNIKMVQHPFYEMPMILYILFYLLRMIILNIISNLILYRLFIFITKKINTFIIFINSILFFIIDESAKIVTSLFEIKLLYHYFFTNLFYTSFMLEMMASFLEIIILIGLYRFISYISLLKKRDLL